MTLIYALVISNKRTAGTLTWQFSPPSVMFYFILPYLPLYINCPTFIQTKGTTLKVKNGSFAGYIPVMSEDRVRG